MSVGAGADPSQTAPLFLGCILTWLLSGSLLVQTYHYFGGCHIQGDNALIKSLVWAAFIIDQIRSMSLTSIAWKGLVVGRGESSAFHGSSVFSALGIPLMGLESCIVQVFFAWRIASLKRDSKASLFIAAFITLLAFMQFGATIFLGVFYYQFQNQNKAEIPLQLSAKIRLSGAFLCDFIIVTTMTTLLVRAKLESSIKSTQRLLGRLIIISFETSAVTLVVTLVQLIFYLKSPMAGCQQVSVMYILGGLYSNALLAVLNGRLRSRSRLAEPSLSIHFTQKSIPNGHPTGPDNAGSEVQSPDVQHQRH